MTRLGLGRADPFEGYRQEGPVLAGAGDVQKAAGGAGGRQTTPQPFRSDRLDCVCAHVHAGVRACGYDEPGLPCP